MTPPAVPRIATWLLRSLLPPSERDVVIGDLVEEHALRCADSTDAARRWYWGQVCRSIPRVLWAGIRRGGWLLTLVIALGVYVVVGTINFGGMALVSAVLGPTGSYSVSDVVVGLCAIGLGGYLAAWIRYGAATVLGATVMCVAVLLMISEADTAPVWYQLAFLVLGPMAAQGGGAIGVTHHARWQARAGLRN